MSRKGFTIIEVLTVALIIGLIAAFVVPRMFRGLGKAKRGIAKSKMAIIEGGLVKFQYHCGRFPNDSEGLEALLEAPGEFEEKWNGPYLKKSDLLDPWENPYIYVEEGMVNPGGFDLISFGADGVEGGEEDTENEDIYND